MKRRSFALAALTLASLLSGCATVRRISDIREHPSQPVLFLETIDRHQILGQTYSVDHVFWQCVERNGALACQRQCGAPGQDFSCPNATATTGGVATNTR